MSLKGLSGVILSYSRLDGGAAPAQVWKVSLFSDFIRGRPTACSRDIYIKRVHSISYVLISEVCVWIEHIYLHVILYYLIAYVFVFVERSCAVSGVSYSSGSCLSRIIREFVVAG